MLMNIMEHSAQVHVDRRLHGGGWFLFSPVGTLDSCCFFGLHTSYCVLYICLSLARLFQSLLIAFDNNFIYTLKSLIFHPFNIEVF